MEWDDLTKAEQRNIKAVAATWGLHPLDVLEDINNVGPDVPKPPTRKPRGFALLPPNRRSEIARQGGLRAHANGTAHEFTPEEAREAGRKGGLAPRKRKR